MITANVAFNFKLAAVRYVGDNKSRSDPIALLRTVGVPSHFTLLLYK